VGADRTGRVPRLDARSRPSSSRSSPWRLRPALQPASASPRPSTPSARTGQRSDLCFPVAQRRWPSRRARWARPRVPRRCLIRRDCGRVAHFLTTLIVLVSFVSIGASVDHAAIAAASCARLQDRRTRVTEPNACPCGSERHDRGSGALHLGGFVGQRDGPALHESKRNRNHNSVLGMLPNQHKRRSTACAVPAGSASVRRRLAWSSDVQAHIRRHIRRQPCARPVRRQLQGAPPGGTRALWHRPLRRRRPPARWRSCRV